MGNVSRGLMRLFAAEIANEHIEETGDSRDGSCSPGGANPATLASCLDSLDQGLELVPNESATLRQELKKLIVIHGTSTGVRTFLNG